MVAVMKTCPARQVQLTWLSPFSHINNCVLLWLWLLLDRIPKTLSIKCVIRDINKGPEKRFNFHPCYFAKIN